MLPEFCAEQVSQLAEQYGLEWDNQAIELLMDLVGGHPYLVRIALHQLVETETSLATFLEEAPTESGPYGDHLRRHLCQLEEQPELASAFQQAIASPDPVQIKSLDAFKLHSMGLVCLQGNAVVPRCQLYRQYFGDRLESVSQHPITRE